MAVYLPIRALNRSSAIRVDGQKLSATVTSYVDISKGSVRKEIAYHSSIGQILHVGSITGSNVDQVVNAGGLVTAGAGLTVNVSVGEMRVRSTGAFVVGAAATNSTITANASGNPRIDLVVWDNVTGAVSVIAGTAAASPVAPSASATQTPLATVAVANGAGAPGTITDVRPRG